MTVIVSDSFEIKSDRAGSSHGPGAVVLFDASSCSDDVPSVGFLVDVKTPAGLDTEIVIDEEKVHGGATSFFFGGLHKTDVPVGSRISWSDDRSKWRRAQRQTVTK